MVQQSKLPRGAVNIDLVHVRNARTYRGLTTVDGLRVRDDMLVRTARLSKASSADLARLRELGVTAVVDLRLGFEAHANPDLRMPGVTYINTPMASDQVTADNPTLPELFGYMRNHDDAHAQMEAGYAKIVTDDQQRASLAQFVQTVVTTPGAVAFHCSMGKDRTGVAAAVILAALGVPRTFIDADYMYSNVTNAQHMHRLTAELAKNGGNETMRRNLLALAATNTDYLDAAFMSINREFGDAQHFVRDGLGLGTMGLTQLRAKLLI